MNLRQILIRTTLFLLLSPACLLAQQSDDCNALHAGDSFAPLGLLFAKTGIVVGTGWITWVGAIALAVRQN